MLPIELELNMDNKLFDEDNDDNDGSGAGVSMLCSPIFGAL